MHYCRTSALFVLVLLCACGPRIEAQRAVGGRVVTITNADNHTFRLQRLVVNERGGDPDCIDRPSRELAPSESYDVTFFICGPVVKLEVQTNEGSSYLQW